MFKRFMMGYLLGLVIMYYYLHHAEQDAQSAVRKMDKTAADYRGDKAMQDAEK